MTSLWKKLLHKQEERLVQRGHPSLGLLEFDPEEEAWVARATLGGRRIRILVVGELEPDPRLVDRAAHVFADYESFQKDITRFLELEAADRPQFSDEIRHLEVADVCFYWPDRPKDAMLFFAGSDDSRVWHCDHLDGCPSLLTFDS
jgi:hypothetical protein